MDQSAFQRIVLKLSGEILAGNLAYGIDGKTVDRVASQIREVKDLGIEVGVVVGGGNIIRGTSSRIPGVDRITGDSMGMLATIINSLALKSSLEAQGVSSHVLSAISIEGIVEPFEYKQALSHLKNGHPVIFAGGTGHPYFTTDTTAALRAVEIGAEAIFKGTKVDGVYSDDPVKNPQATKYDHLSFLDILEKNLRVLDVTAAALCMDNNIKLIVFNIQEEDVLKRILSGESIGTIVEGIGHGEKEL